MSTVKEQQKKAIGGKIFECKEIERDGVKLGIVEGYLITFEIDRGDDRFSPGAFDDSIAELKRMGKTQLPLKDTHGRTIGGFPFETLREDSKGLFGVGEINLDIELGRDAYALANQKVYDSFSVGYRATDVDFIDDIREIRKADIFEGSLLDIPMNLSARVTEVKALAEKAGIDIEKLSEDEYKEFVKHMDVYFKKLDKETLPEIKALSLEEIKELDERTLEGMLKKGVRCESKVAKALIRVIKESDLREAVKDSHREGDEGLGGVLGELKKLQTELEEK